MIERKRTIKLWPGGMFAKAVLFACLETLLFSKQKHNLSTRLDGRRCTLRLCQSVVSRVDPEAP